MPDHGQGPSARGDGPRPTVAPDSWASVRLIQGSSSANHWQVDGSQERLQLRVGADEDCDWQVNSAGVAPAHFELLWDGTRLWISDTHGVGGLTLDGGRVGPWQAISGRARIEFGNAVMLAECSAPAVSVAASTLLGQLAALGPSDGEATRLVRNNRGGPGAGRPAAHEAPTTIAEAPEVPRAFGPAPMGRGPGPTPMSRGPAPLGAPPDRGPAPVPVLPPVPGQTLGSVPSSAPFGGPPPMPPDAGMSPSCSTTSGRPPRRCRPSSCPARCRIRVAFRRPATPRPWTRGWGTGR